MDRTYEFTLTFAVPACATVPDDQIEKLAEAGCDDALVGTGSPGRLALQFNRVCSDADSAFGCGENGGERAAHFLG